MRETCFLKCSLWKFDNWYEKKWHYFDKILSFRANDGCLFPLIVSIFILSFFPYFSFLDLSHAFKQDGILKCQYQDRSNGKIGLDQSQILERVSAMVKRWFVPMKTYVDTWFPV